jgi:hypothetical protein
LHPRFLLFRDFWLYFNVFFICWFGWHNLGVFLDPLELVHIMARSTALISQVSFSKNSLFFLLLVKFLKFFVLRFLRCSWMVLRCYEVLKTYLGFVFNQLTMSAMKSLFWGSLIKIPN